MWPFSALFGKSRSFPKVDGYRIVQRLDEGGFGEVFLARDVLKQLVAIKVLKRERMESPIDQKRFWDEAQKLFQLDRSEATNIVEFKALVRSLPDKRPCIVMEYVAGGSVRELLKKKERVAPEDACRIIGGAARGAEWIFRITHGIHRDIKPENILLDRNRTAKLIDLGIWRNISEHVVQSAERLTGPGVVVGTERYIAPEIRNGRREDIRPWSDVYSLGVVFYQLLTEKPPPLVVDDIYDAPSVVCPNAGIPEELNDICLKCLKREPAERYPTPGELADELGKIVQELWGRPAGEGSADIPPSTRPWDPVKARRKPMLALVLVACLLTWGVFRDGDKKKEAPEQPDRRAALYFLSIKGTIRVKEKAGDITDVSALPKGPLTLTHVKLKNNPNVENSSLEYLKDCKDVSHLYLGGCKRVEDKGLANLKGIKSLTHLELQDTQVTKKGLINFKDCKDLFLLHLLNTQVDDDGLAHLAECKELAIVNLGFTLVSDKGLEQLRNCKKLRELGLEGAKKVTDAGIRKLKEALPLCEVITRSPD